MGGYMAVFAVVSLLGVISPGKGGVRLQIAAALGVVVAAALAIRFATGSCIVETDGGVQVRAALRSHTYRWGEIRGFRSEQGLVGAAAYRRKVLVLDMTDGRTLTFRALNCAPDGGWVDDAAVTFNRRLASSRP
jgi:hypothetical protein